MNWYAVDFLELSKLQLEEVLDLSLGLIRTTELQNQALRNMFK